METRNYECNGRKIPGWFLGVRQNWNLGIGRPCQSLKLTAIITETNYLAF